MKFIPLLKAKLTFHQSLDIVSFLHDQARETEEYYEDEENSPKRIPDDPSAVIAKYIRVDTYHVVRLHIGKTIQYVVENPRDMLRYTKRKTLAVTNKTSGLYLCDDDREFVFGPLGKKPRCYHFY